MINDNDGVCNAICILSWSIYSSYLYLFFLSDKYSDSIWSDISLDPMNLQGIRMSWVMHRPLGPGLWRRNNITENKMSVEIGVFATSHVQNIVICLYQIFMHQFSTMLFHRKPHKHTWLLHDWAVIYAKIIKRYRVLIMIGSSFRKKIGRCKSYTSTFSIPSGNIIWVVSIIKVVCN